MGCGHDLTRRFRARQTRVGCPQVRRCSTAASRCPRRSFGAVRIMQSLADIAAARRPLRRASMDAARLPTFLVIGAARSGSTWISRNLARHPDVFIPKEKELHFFDQRYEEGIEAYRAYVRAATAEKAIGEATPAYLHTPAAAARIRAHLPDVKLIACLRDPIDRLYSRYWNARGRFEHNKEVSFER